MVVVGRARLTWPGGRESGHGPATGPALGLSLREAVDSYTQTRRGAGRGGRRSYLRDNLVMIGLARRGPQRMQLDRLTASHNGTPATRTSHHTKPPDLLTKRLEGPSPEVWPRLHNRANGGEYQRGEWMRGEA
ncbi:hypothetical protein Pcinc_038040 [Petrolisthes cinctipes]|uniref:Uncharacterized protein n=1 Tax=Petrolisthes cinctipes TaxID=88211 RepID=A0AAE1BRH0_PETCI|nr:hypothetical protein Pcinc_038040 [Petrolisthes cinctipes]